MMSKVLNSGASSRPDIAIRLNDTIAPTIQNAALRGCDAADIDKNLFMKQAQA